MHINLVIVITGTFKASNKQLSLTAPSSDKSTIQQPFKSYYTKSPNVHINIKERDLSVAKWKSDLSKGTNKHQRQ